MAQSQYYGHIDDVREMLDQSLLNKSIMPDTNQLDIDSGDGNYGK